MKCDQSPRIRVVNLIAKSADRTAILNVVSVQVTDERLKFFKLHRGKHYWPPMGQSCVEHSQMNGISLVEPVHSSTSC